MTARHRPRRPARRVLFAPSRLDFGIGALALVIVVGSLVPMVACDGPEHPPVVETPAPSPSRAAALQVGGDAIARALGEAGR